MLTAIKKWGNSHGVRLPLSILSEVEMDQNSTVNISIKDGCIVIEKAEPHKRRKNIVDLFKGYKGNYEAADIDWGKPEGKEIW